MEVDTVRMADEMVDTVEMVMAIIMVVVVDMEVVELHVVEPVVICHNMGQSRRPADKLSSTEQSHLLRWEEVPQEGGLTFLIQ